MRRLPLLFLSIAACTGGTEDLRGGGTDAGSPSTDAGLADAAGALDAGAMDPGPIGCEAGWVELVRAGDDQRLEGFSFAARAQGFAVTSQEEGSSFLRFFDRYGLNGTAPILLQNPEANSPPPVILAYQAGWLTFEQNRFKTYNSSGELAGDGPLGSPIEPLFVVSETVLGVRRSSQFERDLIAFVPSAPPRTDSFGGQAQIGDLVAFGPNRAMVAISGGFGESAIVQLYDLDRGIWLDAFRLPSKTVDGEEILYQHVAAARWQARSTRFFMLVAARLGSTRQFGPRVMYLDDQGLSEGPALHDDEFFVGGYEGLEGDISIGDNAVAIAYGSPFTASDISFDKIYADHIEHVPMEGTAYRTPPLIRKIGDRFALFHADGAEGTADWENVLRMRCDIQD